jgi:hypothetical protein
MMAHSRNSSSLTTTTFIDDNADDQGTQTGLG